MIKLRIQNEFEETDNEEEFILHHEVYDGEDFYLIISSEDEDLSTYRDLLTLGKVNIKDTYDQLHELKFMEIKDDTIQCIYKQEHIKIPMHGMHPFEVINIFILTANMVDRFRDAGL